MTELEQARVIAEQWLDFKMNAFTQMVPGDPDCDACVLARQYVRAVETIESLRKEVEQLRFDSDADKVAMRIEDNQVSLLAGWDEVLIRSEMQLLTTAGYELTLLGFNHTDLLAFSTALPHMDGQDRGSLLELINVTIAEPSHVVEDGQSFLLSDRHHLVCVSVIDGWPRWMPLLKDGSLFCPYPGVFVPFCLKAKTNNLVMVQPDGYIAGHILDRYQEVNGADSIKVL